MHWRRLDSSVFRFPKYTAAERTRYLLFRSDELYSYFGFTPQQYRDFLAADSQGKYFSRHITATFPTSIFPADHHASPTNFHAPYTNPLLIVNAALTGRLM